MDACLCSRFPLLQVQETTGQERTHSWCVLGAFQVCILGAFQVCKAREQRLWCRTTRAHRGLLCTHHKDMPPSLRSASYARPFTAVGTCPFPQVCRARELRLVQNQESLKSPVVHLKCTPLEVE